MEIIDISDRHRGPEKIWFVRIEGNKYHIKTDTPWVLEYIRVGYKTNDSNEYVMYDPSGGPYLEIGDKITDTLTLKRIYKDSGNIIFIIE